MPSLIQVIDQETKYWPKTLDQARTREGAIRAAAGLPKATHNDHAIGAQSWKAPSETGATYGLASEGSAPSLPTAPTAPAKPTMTPFQAYREFTHMQGAPRAKFFRENIALLKSAKEQMVGLDRVAYSIAMAHAEREAAQ